MTRTVLILGIALLLAALALPLAALPLVISFVAALLFAAAAFVPLPEADAQPVALLALTHFRAPPSR